ncbi:protein kinase [uncultured Pelagimonas sp.]|uniref:ORC-CDC6 family AAA ATPase n=1 Tax=uncultured Pelagimonas sp. TaxID=1618102 RepID=UPI0026276374|nr:protein kinase [uncultured Pelagimonas sp.]
MIETSSDRNFACVVCSDFFINDIDATCEKCGSLLNIGTRFLGKTVGSYSLVDYKGRGFYGLTYKCRNRAGIDFAIKVIPKKIYKNQEKDFDAEIKKYLALGEHPNIARLMDCGVDKIDLDGTEIPVYFLVMEWIEGRTLGEFLQDEHVTVTDAYTISTEVAAALDRFERSDLCHNDLNAENVMVVDLSEDELGIRVSRSRVQVKVIDTGSAVFIDDRKPNKISDLKYLGIHTSKLIESAKRSREIPLEQQAFLDTLERLASRLRDEDVNRGFSNAKSYIERIRSAFENKQRFEIEANETLNTPFEFLNALDFSDNSTLVGRLFQNDFPWIRESIMGSSQQVLVTGPRGCGKTMILKNMRLRTRLLEVSDSPSPELFESIVASEDFLGFFVSARVEIGNRLLTRKLPAWAETSENVICYFQLLYALEVIETLVLIKTRFKVEFDLSAELDLLKLVNSSIGFDARSLNEAMSDVRVCISSILKCDFDYGAASILTGGGFLSSISSAFINLHSALAGKTVNFLLDDFSKPKVPAQIQRLLLPLIFVPGEKYFFKVSAHSKSTENSDDRENQYKANRDFIEVNLGKEFLDYSSSQEGQKSVDKTLTNILSKRFDLSDRGGSQFVEPATVLGDGPAKIGEELVGAKNKGTGYNYRGWNTILSLCSGEVSFVIDVFGRLYESHSVDADFPINATNQNRVIKELSKNELLNLRDLPQEHSDLYEVARAFGVLSRDKLYNSEVKSGQAVRRAEYTRMEVGQRSNHGKATDTLNELIASGVFVDGGFSQSSSGDVTQRLLFRKIFTPAFPTTWANRDGFNWTQERFLAFASNPSSFVKEMKDDVEGNRDPDLFDN